MYVAGEIHIGAEAMGEGLGKQAKVLTDTQVRRVLRRMRAERERLSAAWDRLAEEMARMAGPVVQDEG
jgi:hypothetical protein